MRLAREALIVEQRRIREQLGETQQELTSLTEIVTELQEVVPIAPHQANYIQRAIKRLANRAAQRRTQQPGIGNQKTTSTNCCWANSKPISIFPVMMRF